MTKRFRVIAGPNGSGKTTLAAWLARDYAVNFYTMLNADDVFAQVGRTHAFFTPFPVNGTELVSYAEKTEYAEAEKARFRNREIAVDADCVRFRSDEAVNSYTVALLVNFLQDECIKRGVSFSQETVFSHPSKVVALVKARAAGFRTYLYFVATDDARINADRVAVRYVQGGHDVPSDKISARYVRSLANLPAAMPYLSRAFFFDNSGPEMRHIASYSEETGLDILSPRVVLPRWFKDFAAHLRPKTQGEEW
jgi:predicted ABC-type ATPase